MKQIVPTLLMMLVVFAVQAELRYRHSKALEGSLKTPVVQVEETDLAAYLKKAEAIRQARSQQAYHELRSHLETAVNLAEIAHAEKSRGQSVTTEIEMRACQIEIERVARKLKQEKELASIREFAAEAAKAVGTGDFQTIQRYFWFCMTQ